VADVVEAVEADGMRSIRRHHNRKQFANRLIGNKITEVNDHPFPSDGVVSAPASQPKRRPNFKKHRN
jgi:hypothetical protein